MQAFPIRRNGEHSTKDNLKLKASLKLDCAYSELVNALRSIDDYFVNH